ncbi:MAG: GLUG motif-containing protein [Candidatus ainarchaeum sp.]|nr:GLUG motif-containing protein [Candidatus ainarchaeum sp.]
MKRLSLKGLFGQGTDLLKKGQSKFSVCNFVKLHGQGTIEYLVQPFFKKAGEKSFHKWNCAQGTIEYLVLLAVVLIVALLGVFLINGLGNGEAINVTGDKLLSTSSGVSVVDAVVDGDGNGLVSLSNRTGQGITIKSIGGSEYTYFLPSGESVVFSATELDDLGCRCSGVETSRVCVVPVTYEDSKGIPKTESIKIEMSCVESEYIDFSNAVSPGTTATSGGGSSSGGNSSTSGGVTPLNSSVPSVVLLSPASGFDFDEDYSGKTVDFNFSVSSSVDLNYCSLNVNGVDVNTLSDVNRVGTYILSHTFSTDGNYLWKVNCTNSSGTSTVSNLNLTMDNNYQEIIDCQGLQDMNKHLDGNYRLMNNIDCNGFNFSPIGNFRLKAFKGFFNGQDFNIFNLTIIQYDKNFIGLFSYTSGAEIKNVRLVDSNIIGNLWVGSLVALTDDSTVISNVYVFGEVYGDYGVGGLVGGNNYGSIISNSYFDGDVIGVNIVGGLVGENDEVSVISDSFSNVNLDGNMYVGGLVGYNDEGSLINNCYAEGVVIGGWRVGGLVGYNYSDSLVFNSFSFVEVFGNINFGGLIGNTYGEVSNSYYDINTSNQSDTGKGIPKTTLELTTLPIPSGVYTDWNFDTIWSHDVNGSYPILKWQTE